MATSTDMRSTSAVSTTSASSVSAISNISDFKPTVPPPANTPLVFTAIESCTSCYLTLETGLLAPTEATGSAAFVVFTAWAVNSQYSVEGYGCEISAWTTSLAPPYLTITVPTSSNELDVPSAAAQSFAASKGFAQCYADYINYINTELVNVSNLVVSGTPSFANTTRTGTSGILNETSKDPAPAASDTIAGPKVSLAILMPIVAVIALVAAACAILVLKRYRRGKRDKDTKGKTVSSSDDTPYLQQKGELEAVQARFELDGNPRPLEVSGDDEIREMTTPANLRLHADRSELRGDEHCKELRGEEHSKELE